MENKKVYFEYSTLTEIQELINKLVSEIDNINYDRENIDNIRYRKNAEEIHTTLLKKLSDYKQ